MQSNRANRRLNSWHTQEQQELMSRLSEPKMDCPLCAALATRCSGRLRAPSAPNPTATTHRETTMAADSVNYVRKRQPKGRRCQQVVCRRCPQGCREPLCSKYEAVAPLMSSLLTSARRPTPLRMLSRPTTTPQPLDLSGRIRNLRPSRRITRDHALQVRGKILLK